MKDRTRWGAAVVVAIAGLAVAGDEPKTYDIDWKERWEAKQVVTVTLHDSTDTDKTMGGNSTTKEHESLDAVYVVRCDEAATEGKPSKKTVFVKSWKSTKNATTDESLTGALLSVSGGEWKLAGGKPASPIAKKWLNRRFGSNHHMDPLEKIAPKQLTIGQPWKPDPKVVAETFGKAMGDMPLDASNVSMELVLESAEGTPPDAAGKCVFKVHLSIGEVPNLPPNSVVRPGSGADVTGARIGPLTKSTMLGTMHMDADLKVEIEVPTPQGAKTATITGKMIRDQTTVAGGEIPEPKPAEPAGGK